MSDITITAERAEELATLLGQQEGFSAEAERTAEELIAALRKLADLMREPGPCIRCNDAYAKCQSSLQRGQGTRCCMGCFHTEAGR